MWLKENFELGPSNVKFLASSLVKKTMGLVSNYPRLRSSLHLHKKRMLLNGDESIDRFRWRSWASRKVLTSMPFSYQPLVAAWEIRCLDLLYSKPGIGPTPQCVCFKRCDALIFQTEGKDEIRSNRCSYDPKVGELDKMTTIFNFRKSSLQLLNQETMLYWNH
jgi:hypothetical protein